MRTTKRKNESYTIHIYIYTSAKARISINIAKQYIPNHVSLLFIANDNIDFMEYRRPKWALN